MIVSGYDHMRETLELIAGHFCEAIEGGNVHIVLGDVECSHSLHFGARFALDTCPVCMARKCLEQIDAAERAGIA